VVSSWTDAELYRRGCATLVASWAEYASGCEAATVRRLPGVDVAVFARDPERAVYNNALLRRDAPAATALEDLAAAYGAAGVRHFAAWVHDSDEAARVALVARGYTLDTTTRAMGMPLRDLPVPDPGIEVRPVDWPDYLAMADLPPDFLRTADHAALHPLVGRDGDGIVAAALAYDHEGDCGIYNVATVPRARRHGFATAVTATQLHHARNRGCETASLQSTPMAERLYAALGFRDLGSFLEYAPPFH
jgi:ribosomal protein S18 acetylase RimI-like enzyme